MQLTIEVTESIIDDILITGLKEYHHYLITHPFESDLHAERHDQYDVLVDSFEVVLRCYMTQEEWKNYHESLTH
jgi:hypothetical protein